MFNTVNNQSSIFSRYSEEFLKHMNWQPTENLELSQVAQAPSIQSPIKGTLPKHC